MVLVLALCAPAALAATKTFNITARRFVFEITPSPFVVQQGDHVTLHFTAADNGLGDGHGFFMQRYAENQLTLLPGEPVTFEFVANTAGTFQYACTIFCGNNHHQMFGTFTVEGAQTPAPTIASFSPSSGPVAGGNEVEILGTNFAAGAVVDFGDVRSPSVTVSSATRIVAIAPAQAAGSVAITVTNADNQSVTSTALYTYEAAPPPHIVSVTPSRGSNAGGTRLTITGSGFAAGATVHIGGLAAVNVVVDSPTTLHATTPRGPSDVRTPRDVVVTNPDGQSATLANGFTWTAAVS
ncbi:MAG TPA: IPT/TIG domain-containing protein, partial [Thermoanaerobaculia bacterium]|nr:IPT/TIG domain-containing protein [Thermoanaerobaculia bacterium]